MGIAITWKRTLLGEVYIPDSKLWFKYKSDQQMTLLLRALWVLVRPETGSATENSSLWEVAGVDKNRVLHSGTL